MTDRTGTVTGEAPALRLDELGRKGYRILQDPAAFCFGMDAVLLADFVRAKKTDRVIDLGTGNGILPLLLDARDRGGSFEALETGKQVFAFRRTAGEERTVTVVNLSGKAAKSGCRGAVLANNCGKNYFDGELAPWQAVVLEER